MIKMPVTVLGMFEDLPAISLFVGPASVGKWTVAEALGRRFYNSFGVIRVRALTMDAARDLTMLSTFATPRLVIIRLTRSTDASQNVLLKTLEECSTTATKFILIDTELPPETITSRCTVYRFPLLTDAAVEEILLNRNFSAVEAKKLALAAGGQMRNALNRGDMVDDKQLVLTALRAIIERDSDTLDDLAAKWGDPHSALMVTLCTEAISGRYRIFNSEEIEGIGRKLPLRILIALGPGIRPRLVVRSSLMGVLRSAM